MKVTNFIAFLLVGSQLVYGSETCWKKLASRGIGEIPTECPNGMVKEDGLCYTPCAQGYSSFLTTCTQVVNNCPSPWTYTLGTCTKPLNYLRTMCSPWSTRGCQRIGWSYYKYCNSGYYEDGYWCRAEEDGCPSGMTDNGAYCSPASYNRGIGVAPTGCPAGQEYDTGLCYPECTWEDSNGELIDADGVGPVCWGDCPANTEECGGICLGPEESCEEYMKDATLAAIAMATSFAAQNYWQGVINTIDFLDEVGADEPQCSDW